MIWAKVLRILKKCFKQVQLVNLKIMQRKMIVFIRLTKKCYQVEADGNMFYKNVTSGAGLIKAW